VPQKINELVSRDEELVHQVCGLAVCNVRYLVSQRLVLLTIEINLCLSRGPAAIDREDGTINKFGSLRAEITYELRDILGLSQSTNGLPLDQIHTDFLLLVCMIFVEVSFYKGISTVPGAMQFTRDSVG
jgi:hypothetical protein